MSELDSQKERETVRINLEVTPAVREQIKALRVKSDAASLAEVFRRSLAIYDMIVDVQKDGGKFILENRNGDRETVRIF